MRDRKANRLKNYDYSQGGAYFITICTRDRREILGKIIRITDGTPAVDLSNIGKVVQQHIDSIPSIYNTIEINKYIIMPNHIHLILFIKDEAPKPASRTKATLAKVINAFKSLTSRQYGQSMWQRSFHDHVIRSELDYLNTWQYIDGNLAKWEEDLYFTYHP